MVDWSGPIFGLKEFRMSAWIEYLWQKWYKAIEQKDWKEAFEIANAIREAEKKCT